MTQILQKALRLIVGTPQASVDLRFKKSNRPLGKLTERELLQLESEIGAKLFGEIPKGHRRSFFNLDQTTWIWHEEWVDESGTLQQATTRYEVQQEHILKVQEGPRYSYVEGQELQNLTLAVQMYYEQVMRDVYHRDPQSGYALA